MTELSQPELRAPAGVGGWLLLLCRRLIVFQPLSLAVTASSALGALSVRGAPTKKLNHEAHKDSKTRRRR